MKKYYIFLAFLAVFSAIVMVSELVLQRGLEHDATVEADLRGIQEGIGTYSASERKLPPKLSAISLASKSTQERIGKYQYRVTSNNSYELCATFETKTDAKSSFASDYYTDTSAHNKGRDCFKYQDPDLPTDEELKLEQANKPLSN